MSIIEGLKRDIENPSGAPPKEELKKNPLDFLENDGGRDLFAEYAVNTGDPDTIDLMTKWNAKDRSLDLTQFTTFANEFGGKLEAARKLAERMTPEFIQQLAGQAPEFGKFVKTFGVTKMRDIWKQKLPELMVRDKPRFDRIEAALKRYETTRDAADEKIAKQAEKLGIQPGKYASILSMPDASKRREAMLNVVRDRYGGFKRAIGFASGVWTALGGGGFGGSWSARELAQRGRQEVDHAIADMNKALADICQPLVELMGDDTSDVHHAYTSVLFGEKSTSITDAQVPFSELQKLFGASADYEADIATEWATNKAKTKPPPFSAADFMSQHLAGLRAEMKRKMGGKTESPLMKARMAALEGHLRGVTLA